MGWTSGELGVGMAYDLVKPVKITHRISLYNICRHRYCSCDCPDREGHEAGEYRRELSVMIDQAPDMPSSSAYRTRLGSLARALPKDTNR